jgi:hypothetical protein
MTKRIVFFNYFHNGDIHVSRGMVRQIMNKVHQIDPSVQFAYAHKMSTDLLSDIPGLQFDGSGLSVVNNEHANLHKVGDTTYINTWYGQQHFKYMNRYAVSIDSIYAALSDSCKDTFGFSFDDISTDLTTFFPVIDYTKLNVAPVQSWLSRHPGTKILIENGSALSGQATNFDMKPIIIQLSGKYPDKNFILTSRHDYITRPNVFYSSDITQRGQRTDLNEISFLSTQCDMIIGRASGVWSFTLTQENLFKRNIKYLCFSNLVPKKEGKFWLNELFEDKVNYSSTIITTNESNTDKVREIIEGQL